MNVTINGVSIELFKGATLKHALLKVDDSLYHSVKNGENLVKDQHGNVTDIDGAVGDGFSYSVEKK